MKPPVASISPERRSRAETANPPAFWIENGPGLVFTTIFALTFVLWTLAGRSGVETRKLVSDVLAVVVPIGGALWSLRGARRAGGSGAAANLLSLSVAFYGLAAGIYGYYDLILHRNPFPSWADLAYLANYVTFLAAVLLLPSRPMPWTVRVRVLLDSLMVVAALVTFSWFFALGPTLLAGDSSLLSRVLGASYPVLDLAAIFCALVVAARSPERGIRGVRNLLCVGAVAYVVADTAYCYQNLKGTYETGQPLDVGWMITNLLVGMAASNLRRMKVLGRANVSATRLTVVEASREPSFWRLALPYALVPAVALLLVYVYRERLGGGLATGVYVGSATLIALILARQVFAIAENTRLYRFLQEAYRELEALATTDGMTGLANHRAFQERLRAEIARGEATHRPPCLFLVDVDRFKAYNDAFGHPAGDEALKIVARILRENMRKDDLAARYGGEEFAAILPDTDLEQALTIAERVREACAATTFPHRPVTLSVGVAVGDGSDAGGLIESADHALYAAKRGGRNRVVQAGTQIVEAFGRAA